MDAYKKCTYVNQERYSLNHIAYVELGEKKGTIVSEYELGGDVLCTPAASNDAIFVRSHSHLWKFSE